MVTDDSGLFESVVSLYIDLGKQGTLSSSLRNFVVQDMIRQLRKDHAVDVNQRNFVRGVYYAQLKRFKKGIYADLLEHDPKSYRLKEIDYLNELISVKEDHLKSSLDHLLRARKKQIVVFLDNADQRNEETQEAVFLIAQELAAKWPVTVFMTLRPETFHQSQRTGVLSGYHPRAFSIEPPRIDLVVRRRLEFARQITSGNLSLVTLPDLIVETVSLDSMIAAFLHSIDDNEDLIKAIDNMSAGNIRTGLDWIRQFFGSGHINTDKILNILKVQGSYIVPLHEFLRTVIYGDNRHYDPNSSPVTNLFSVPSIDRREHFLVPICLTVIRRTTDNDGWLDTGTLIDRVQSFGFQLKQINTALQKSTERGLIETSGRRLFIRRLNPPKAVRIRTPGVYHLDYLPPLFVYVDAVVVDTPILETGWRSQITHTESIEPRLDRAELFLEYLDESWQKFTANDTGFDWLTVSSQCRTGIHKIRKRLQRRTHRSVS